MKAVLFCNLPYAFSILKPIEKALIQRDIDYLWYVPRELIAQFPYKNSTCTTDITVLKNYPSDMIFVPGNHVPWFLRGVKVQVFHGLAGEKKGHFRIREYFDLYLTQGPYFTQRFNSLKKKHKNFSVVETGWSKLDDLYRSEARILEKKQSLLAQSQAKYIILFAPTFSPSLSCAEPLYEQIIALSKVENYMVVVKFHDKQNLEIISRYTAAQSNKLIIARDDSIIDALKFADLMVSDTSSAVYEFLILDKPVITLNTRSENIHWCDLSSGETLIEEVDQHLGQADHHSDERKKIISLYHPYSDGKSSVRMVGAVLNYISVYGVPEKRKVPMLRKYQTIKKYGLP